MPIFDQKMISYRSIFLFQAHGVLKVLEHSNHVEGRCGLSSKANVAFAFSFVSPQFIPVSAPHAIVCFHKPPTRLSVFFSHHVRHFFFIWPYLSSLSLDSAIISEGRYIAVPVLSSSHATPPTSFWKFIFLIGNEATICEVQCNEGKSATFQYMPEENPALSRMLLTTLETSTRFLKI